MIKIIVSILLCCFCLGEFRANFSSFQEGTMFMSSIGFKGSLKDGNAEYSIMFDRSQSPTRIVNRGSLNSDTDITEKLSWFYFAQDDNNVWREGVGVGYEFFNELKSFPFRHKISFAEVYDQRYGYIVSTRYKTQAYIDGFAFSMVCFSLGYTYNVDYKLGYEIRPNLSIIYKGYYDDYSNVNQSSIGIETKL